MFSILSLVCAGLVFVLCASQWLVYAHSDMRNEGYSIVDVFQDSGNIIIENDSERVSPLVSQAGDYALIIDPPKPPEVVKEVEPPQPKVTPSPPANAPRPSARFKLLSTSCNLDRPEDSIALIDEPGKGEHWAKVGDFIGNFVLEKIELGTIIYRYGSQVSEMAVEINQPVRIVQQNVPKVESIPRVKRKSILGLE